MKQLLHSAVPGTVHAPPVCALQLCWEVQQSGEVCFLFNIKFSLGEERNQTCMTQLLLLLEMETSENIPTIITHAVEPPSY